MRNRRKIAGITAVAGAIMLMFGVSSFADSRPENESWRRGDAARADRDAARSADAQRARPENRDAVIREGREADRRDGDAYRETDRRDGDRRDGDRNDGWRSGQQRSGAQEGRRNADYRQQDGRVTELGRIRSMSRERDGYRVHLDGGRHSYWIPSSRLGGHQLRVGLSLRLGGIFRGGYVIVDALGWPGDRYYNDPYYDGYDRGYRYSDDQLRGWVEQVDHRRGTMRIREQGRRARVYTVDARRLDDRYRGLDLRDLRRGDYVTLSGNWTRNVFVAWRIENVDPRY